MRAKALSTFCRLDMDHTKLL